MTPPRVAAYGLPMRNTTIGRLRLHSRYARSAASVAASKSAGSVDSPISIHLRAHSPKRAACAGVMVSIRDTADLLRRVFALSRDPVDPGLQWHGRMLFVSERRLLQDLEKALGARVPKPRGNAASRLVFRTRLPILVHRVRVACDLAVREHDPALGTHVLGALGQRGHELEQDVTLTKYLFGFHVLDLLG